MNQTETPQAPGAKTFRGRTLEEVLPRIKAELGPDAVITAQRDGLAGGIGGFFQRQFIEIEARPGSGSKPAAAASRAAAPRPRLDVLDDAPARPAPPPRREPGPREDFDDSGPDPAAGPDLDAPGDDPAGPIDAATAEGLSSPAIQQVLGQAAPFVERRGRSTADLAAAFPLPAPAERSESEARPPGPFARELDIAQRREADAGPPPAATPPPPRRPDSGAPRPAGADAVEQALTAAGLSPPLAESVVAETVTHLVPFASPRAVKRLARIALSRRIRVQGSVGTGARTVAFVGAGGAGKTLCAARLAAAYAQAATAPVTCISVAPDDGGARLALLLGELGVPIRVAESAADALAIVRAAGPRALVAVDTPAVSPRDAAGVRALGGTLAGLPALELHLTVPATASAAAARSMVEGFSPLGPLNLVLTHADETEHMGAPVDVSIETGLPLSFVGRGTLVPGGLEPADALAVARLMLP